MTTRARIPNDTAGNCATCGNPVAPYEGTALRLQSRMFLYHNHCAIAPQATDSKRVRDMEHFKRLKAAIIRKWGEKLVTGTQADYDAIMKECEPLAKFAHVQPARIHIGLVGQYKEDATVADVLLTWHDPEPVEPWQPNQSPKGCYIYEIFRCGSKVVGGTYTVPKSDRDGAVAFVARRAAEKGFVAYRLDGAVHPVQP